MASAPSCPVCSGPCWDNRATKRNPKQPDFKCKDKGCSGVIWPPRTGGAPRQAASAKQPINVGEMDWEQEQAADESRFVGEAKGSPPATVDKLNALLGGYSLCFAHASHLAQEAQKKGLDPDVSAMAATILIQACQKGII